MHWYPVDVSEHWPPFLQGLGSHASKTGTGVCKSRKTEKIHLSKYVMSWWQIKDRKHINNNSLLTYKLYGYGERIIKGTKF